MFRLAERDARLLGRGLWSSCGEEKKSQAESSVRVTPGDVSGACVIKGNINADGDKIYHLPDCAYYGRTVISEERGEKFFCSEAEAIASGFRKAGNCP